MKIGHNRQIAEPSEGRERGHCRQTEYHHKGVKSPKVQIYQTHISIGKKQKKTKNTAAETPELLVARDQSERAWMT